jgi:hypothetical protein
MKLDVYKSLWGMNGSLEASIERIAEAGYEGVEGPVPTGKDALQFRSLLEQYQLAYIADIYTEADHTRSFRDRLALAAEFGPVKINSHSVKDWMPFDEQCRFFEKALEAAGKLSVVCAHETHRSRAMYSPWSTAALLREFPELQLTADFSHWVVVCESLLQDQQEDLSLAISRTIHIHGRVGFHHGPQVPDPRAPEYAVEREAHEGWWDEMVRQQAARGIECITFTPEFGPPGYMHTLPYTRQPLADLWEVCLWMAQNYRKRFAGLNIGSKV